MGGSSTGNQADLDETCRHCGEQPNFTTLPVAGDLTVVCCVTSTIAPTCSGGTE